MGFSTSTCTEFVEVLASKAPVPGGGGASALVGAVGTALGNMVGSLTVGKKKYADVEEEMWELKGKCDQLQKDFLRLIERDAEVFEPLSKAYGMPKETEEEKAEKARVMAIVLKDACSVPMEIMEKCCEALDLIKEFAAKGSTASWRSPATYVSNKNATVPVPGGSSPTSKLPIHQSILPLYYQTHHRTPRYQVL